MDEAQHLADRVAILRDGVLVAEGSTKELASSLGQRTVVRAPQHDVYRLLDWADGKGIELSALEVRRPSLEDIFLELTSEEGGER
jgi:ABC-2 type transport system ATP-binding protein